MADDQCDLMLHEMKDKVYEKFGLDVHATTVYRGMRRGDYSMKDVRLGGHR